MEPGGSMRIHKGSPIIPILSRTTQFLESTPTIYLRFSIILSSHLRLGFPNGLFLVNLPIKIWKALLSSSILATCPTHLYV